MRSLTAEEAKKVVVDAMESAGTTDGGQLAPDRCGILVIGGFRLKQVEMKNLGRGAAALFGRRPLSHVAAIVVLSLGVNIESVNMVAGAPVLAPGASAQTTLAVEACRNPRYLGPVLVTEGSPPGWSSLGPHTEIDGSDDPSLRSFR